ncbi:SDR family oxidoreductase [Paenibacillus sp.]|uniref:SDR family oxidoreductase n=1 Tax=Paenibacillus sp. TaxID=58172 RepID=UPI002D3A6312|nr:SDR family oxidoreductase [Paenibacillus sp.]HZG84625.1 SDR family oxidoreductase [Paenibacillus sp.]
MERQRTLAGKTALVTGSARGLGRMTALQLAALGCNVAVNYVRSERDALELVDRLRAFGVRAAAVRADVGDPASARRLVDETERLLDSGIDILVNNAGPFVRERRSFADAPEDELEMLVQGNLLGPMRLDRLVIPGMRERGFGRIVHFGFGRSAEARGWPHRGAYAAAKVALVSLTKTLAVEEAGSGITVNMVCPGDIRGNNKEKRIDEVRGEADPEASGRPGSGEDVARVIAFLCDPASDYVTGNIVDVTGGFDPIRYRFA